MAKKPIALVVVLMLSSLLGTGALASLLEDEQSTEAQEDLEYRKGAFVWKPSRITMSLEVGMGGDLLRFDQELPDGEKGWTMMRMDLPDTWEISDLRFEGLDVCFENQLGQSFRLKARKISKLSWDLLDGGPNKPDEELEALWRRYALRD